MTSVNKRKTLGDESLSSPAKRTRREQIIDNLITQISRANANNDWNQVEVLSRSLETQMQNMEDDSEFRKSVLIKFTRPGRVKSMRKKLEELQTSGEEQKKPFVFLSESEEEDESDTSSVDSTEGMEYKGGDKPVMNQKEADELHDAEELRIATRRSRVLSGDAFYDHLIDKYKDETDIVYDTDETEDEEEEKHTGDTTEDEDFPPSEVIEINDDDNDSLSMSASSSSSPPLSSTSPPPKPKTYIAISDDEDDEKAPPQPKEQKEAPSKLKQVKMAAFKGKDPPRYDQKTKFLPITQSEQAELNRLPVYGFHVPEDLPSCLRVNTAKPLREHQLNTVLALYQRRCVLACHPTGSGKTITSIASGVLLLDKGIVDFVVVATVKSAVKQFEKEWASWTKGQDETRVISRCKVVNHTALVDAFTSLSGDGRVHEPRPAIAVKTLKYFSYDSASRWLLVVDEGHVFNNVNSGQSRVMTQLCKASTRTLLLTATPARNDPGELYSLISLGRGESLPVLNLQKGEKQPLVAMANEFRKRIASSLTRKDDYVKKFLRGSISYVTIPDDSPNFPRVVMHVEAFEMPLWYLDIYNQVEQRQIQQDETKKEFNKHGIEFKGESKFSSAFYSGLRAAINNAEVSMDRVPPKIERIMQIINSHLRPNGRPGKVVVFSSFLENGIVAVEKSVNTQHSDWKTTSIHGQVSEKKREAIRKQFNKGDIDILFIGEAGSTSLDLEGVTLIIVMESAWNSKEVEQVIGRGKRYRSFIPESERILHAYLLILDRPKDDQPSVDRVIYQNMMKAKEEKLNVLDWVMQFNSIEHDPTFRNTVKSQVDNATIRPNSL